MAMLLKADDHVSEHLLSAPVIVHIAGLHFAGVT